MLYLINKTYAHVNGRKTAAERAYCALGGGVTPID